MNYIGINVIADRLTRHPLMEDLNMETIIDYAFEFMRLVGIPKTFSEKVARITIEDFKGQLPCDYYKVIQVRSEYGMLRHSTDSFHMAFDNRRGDLTYKLNNGCIFTSFEKGELEMAYSALPVDEEGRPLIPDNSAYEKALTSYIKREHFTMLFELGKIMLPVLQNAQREYFGAVKQATTDMRIPTTDEMEVITRMRNRLLPERPFDHETGYRHMGDREYLNRR